MKEELIRVLNNKLDDINSDIDSLVELNDKITNEEQKRAYISSILNLFKENNETNYMNFSKLSKDDFEKTLNALGNDVVEAFSLNSCNYDGLVYLINGINSGVALSLTDEQKNSILYLIQRLIEKEDEHKSAIEGFNLVKNRYAISSVEELKAKKEKYLTILDDLANNQYVNNTSILTEAMAFSELTDEEKIKILKYLLEYNASVFKSHPHVDIKEEKVNYPSEHVEEKNEKTDSKTEDVQFNDDGLLDQIAQNISNEETISFDDYNDTKPLDEEELTSSKEENNDSEELINNEKNDYQEFHFNEVKKDDLSSFSPLSFYDYSDKKEKNEKEDEILNTTNEVTEENKEENTSYYEYDENNDSDEVLNTSQVNHEETLDNKENDVEQNKDDNVFSSIMNNLKGDTYKEPVTNFEEETNTTSYQDNTIERISTSDLNALLAKYGIQENESYINELVTGDIKNYEDILNTLKDNDLIDLFKNNSELLVETLLYSDSSIIKNVLSIIKDDLSVDNEDYIITLKIVVNTIPTIFISNVGNYDNFIKNVKLFKELDLNLINLFDFSKELFVASNNTIMNNLEIVNKYDVNITYQNAKYFMLLKDIGDRIDYYVESVYLDKEKNAVFDGIDYVNNYTAKLNTVTDETIKRLRFCSETGKKVFGNKPGSLTADITHLKVNTLDITSEYLNTFFNNKFATLTGDEVREYTKLIHNSSNVGNYDDELEMLNKYRNGLRYVIEGINISYNKVLRNYCILRSYGINVQKALHFAVCYNLVITKDEYDKLKNVLDELGGRV